MFCEVVCEVAIILAIFMSPFIIGCLLWDCTGFRPAKWFYHDFMKWHEPDMYKGSYMDENGEIHAFCKHCGRDIYEAPNGGWDEYY